MDPTAMKAAMEAMQKLPPDQLQRMMAGMGGSITPEMMAQAQQMASRMSPDDWRRATEQVSSMNPADLERQAAAATSQFSAQQKYVLTASQHLKNEGNQLHSAGRYTEALEKYERAKQNVSSHTSTEAAELRRACTLNLSSCYLNLQDWGKCIEQCNEVLAGEPESLKALYRRGQAYMGVAGWAQAVEDLSRALKLSAGDPAQQKLIREKLQDSKDKLSSQRAAAALQPSAAMISDTPAQSETHVSTVDGNAISNGFTTTNVESNNNSSSSSQPAPVAPASTSTAAVLPPQMDPNMLQAAAGHMRSNPDWARQVQQTMSSMSDSQLRDLSRNMGHEITRDQLGNLDWANSLDPEQLEKIAKFQKQLQDNDMVSRLRANPKDPQVLAAATQMMQDNPDMMSTMADMLQHMSPEQLEQMARQSGMPAQSFTPEMIKTAASAFKNMKPEELKAMTEMAAKMAPPGGHAASFAPTSSTSSAGPVMHQAPSTSTPLPAGVSASSSASTAAGSSSEIHAAGPMPAGMPAMTPEMMKMASEMMASMPPEQIQAMTGGRAGMPNITPEMAKMAADMMAKMNPEDMQRMAAMMGNGGMSRAPMAGASGAGGMPTADMLGKMDPKMMESAMSMMRTMDNESLASMLMSSGMVRSQAQAEAMAAQVKGMSDSQLKMMAKAAQVVQSGAQAVKKTKDFIASRSALLVALAVILLAVLLRWLGIM